GVTLLRSVAKLHRFSSPCAKKPIQSLESAQAHALPLRDKLLASPGLPNLAPGGLEDRAMSPRLPAHRWTAWVIAHCLFWGGTTAFAQEGMTLPPLEAKVHPSATLSRENAVRWALEANPELAAMRQQRGIAAAG